MKVKAMYRYDEFDYALVEQRVTEFRDQVQRRLSGALSEDEFRPLRLRNGVYLQLHAYMMRVAIPYGVLSSKQLRMLGYLADKYDKGYGHFTTRQNIQYNWLRLIDIPDMLKDLASIEMHAIQTSGDCIRNITIDPFAGVAGDELIDPRPVGELLRQWSTLHPEFSYLPRKFKIALTGGIRDRAAIMVHDIGLRVVAGDNGDNGDNGDYGDYGDYGFQVWVGGGQGRTPILAVKLRDYIAKADLLRYLEAILRIYNGYGRRDNKYKARLKILIKEAGIERFTSQVEAEFKRIDKVDFEFAVPELARISEYFRVPRLAPLPDSCDSLQAAFATTPEFKTWVDNNCFGHKTSGYVVVSISLKPIGGIPGDATAHQMREIANLADHHSLSEIRVTHRQNLVLPYVKKNDLFELWQKLGNIGLSAGNINRASDIISCPGLDYCTLATARSICVAQTLSEVVDQRDRQDDIGPVSINISGCINACGHHYIANIGILGLDKRGEEFYQITLGGSSDNHSAIGKIIGRSFNQQELPEKINQILDVYLANRKHGETFLDVYRRIGSDRFKEALYAFT